VIAGIQVAASKHEQITEKTATNAAEQVSAAFLEKNEK